MEVLFVTKPVKLVREAKTLKIIDIENNTSRKIPLRIINSVYLFGNVDLTQGARNLLLENNKEIYYFSSKGEFKGVLHNAKLSSNYKNRLVQYKNLNNLQIAKFIVFKKIEEIEKWTKKSLNRYKEKLNQVQTINEVLGVEGSASLYMFAKVREMLDESGIEFQKREYKPVKDRVNGLLSFIYTIHYNFLHTIVMNKGFDPYIGFLHKKRGKHMAFVSDIMEKYRVILTAFVVKILQDKIVSDDDFEGLYLNYEGRKKFLGHYVELLENLNHTDFIDELQEKLYQVN
jgi:CRISPR-associated protein Cas1